MASKMHFVCFLIFSLARIVSRMPQIAHIICTKHNYCIGNDEDFRWICIMSSGTAAVAIETTTRALSQLLRPIEIVCCVEITRVTWKYVMLLPVNTQPQFGHIAGIDEKSSHNTIIHQELRRWKKKNTSEWKINRLFYLCGRLGFRFLSFTNSSIFFLYTFLFVHFGNIHFKHTQDTHLLWLRRLFSKQHKLRQQIEKHSHRYSFGIEEKSLSTQQKKTVQSIFTSQHFFGNIEMTHTNPFGYWNCPFWWNSMGIKFYCIFMHNKTRNHCMCTQTKNFL